MVQDITKDHLRDTTTKGHHHRSKEDMEGTVLLPGNTSNLSSTSNISNIIRALLNIKATVLPKDTNNHLLRTMVLPNTNKVAAASFLHHKEASSSDTVRPRTTLSSTVTARVNERRCSLASTTSAQTPSSKAASTMPRMSPTS